MTKYLHPLLAGVALMTLASAYIISKDLNNRGKIEDLAFPAEALRTAELPPTIELTNHLGEPFSLKDDTQGDVVMITALYASCPHTCPAIIQQAKRVADRLSEEQRQDLHILGITMDPENDSPEALAELAEMHGLVAPLFEFLTGDPDEVNALLDQFGVLRERNLETGVIDHVNLYFLLDRQGKIAYRLTLGDQQERWLESALAVLLEE
jgi:protein SCO1/2